MSGPRLSYVMSQVASYIESCGYTWSEPVPLPNVPKNQGSGGAREYAAELPLQASVNLNLKNFLNLLDRIYFLTTK